MTAKEEAATVDEVKVSIHVASSPHLSGAVATRGMMVDVLIGLVPVMGMAVWLFGWYAVRQVGLCVISCVVCEAFFMAWCGRGVTLRDCSAIVTGVILGLSLPWNAPWYVGVVGSVVAIGTGKVVFGGLGQNIFNPAMVGRAFVMLSFSAVMGGAAYMSVDAGIDIVSQATPLSGAKEAAAGFEFPSMWVMFIGNGVNGSLGETSALACIIGGMYMCIRRTASWEISAASILGLIGAAGVGQLISDGGLTIDQHLLSGAFLLGAFFIVTDPVTSPVTVRGKWLFGIGYGVLVVLIRLLSSYPEGVLFAVLLMNAVTPLINRWTIPTPVGGPMPERV